MTEVRGGDDKPHQRIGAISNAHAGRAFEDAVQAFFAAQGLILHRDFPVDIGHDRKKRHRFDLGSDAPPVLIECKSYAWTATGNSPSAKIRSLNEAILHFMLVPPGYRKMLVMMRSERLAGGETLAVHYARTQGHLVPPDVELWQFDTKARTCERVAVPVPSEPAGRRARISTHPDAEQRGTNWRMPTTDDFAEAISAKLREAGRRGAGHIDINSGELHRELGGYPGPRAAMPSCCNALYAARRLGDEILSQPPKGKGASLTIRFKLPR